MGPPILHAVLAVMAIVLVYLGFIQSGTCALGTAAILYGAAALAVSANIALVPAPKIAVIGGVVAMVLLLLGVYWLNGVIGCSI
jgi:hypothetical protein